LHEIQGYLKRLNSNLLFLKCITNYRCENLKIKSNEKNEDIREKIDRHGVAGIMRLFDYSKKRKETKRCIYLS
jgi:hypothetical protein